MEAELKALELKISQLADLCQRLRADNQQLRQQLASTLNDNKHLQDKIDKAAARLEKLLVTLPEEQA